MTHAERFIKISAAGEQLPPDAEAWDAVLDTQTGLMWTATDAAVDHYGEAEGAATSMTAAGFSDWRLPTVEELFLLADRSRVSPAIDTRFFPDCKSDWYWTSTPLASSPGGVAWDVNFGYGDAGWNVHGNDGFVRAVRSAPASQ